jgi:hypothetical protein
MSGGTYSILGLDERVVHGDNLDVGVLDTVQLESTKTLETCYIRIAEDDTANTAKSVDTNL